MEFTTVDHWDQSLWKKVKAIYERAFAEKGAKPEKIIRNMFRKQICFLHILEEDENAVGMAITGKLKGSGALLIDYLAVAEEARGEGIGHKFLDMIKEWSFSEGNFDSFLIEVESEPTAENLARIDFWRNCGFTPTDYIHHYIWVPEPYQAMYFKLKPTTSLPTSGEELFQLIGNFHKASYQGS